ncbi:tetratricopeptide repeat protein [Sphingobacterium psychroaquaticum]|uniref:Tetratricopeptide repeat-containing protein n=1 Tax=Sphingobacterium psychroaquaticum TaxID=561061 RepID=A0A1X7KNU4_9SPHI|nr:tetratricopeptide repeat protein [Sphingobacterium psychroaquaticum]QBQ40506.1 tetratricopeptide repeat protein [Sphingobacterium psychroaquaticum]SMG42889.1 Tetratricopeptide repeat-containing protein [Sphingobacterium psychroaquaticum]
MYKKVYGVGVALSLMGSASFAQQTAWQQVNNAYKSGMELFERGKYSSAAKQFDRVEEIRTKSSLQLDETEELTLIKENVRYYQAICALELGDSNAESRFLKYIKDYPASANSKAAYFQIGKSYYAKKDYGKAIEWFQKIDSKNLAGAENTEYRFKLAYAQFMTNDYKAAKPLFERLKDDRGQYQEASIYYYAYLCYLDAEYKTALNEFERLNGSKVYENSYPYYITALYFLDKRYDDVLSYALPVLSRTKQEHETEIFRIVGATYFIKGDLQKSKEYYDKFQAQDQGKTQNNQDSYQIGYIAYKLGDYEKAIKELEKLSEPDAYFQSAMITLGDSFLKTGNKQSARNAFFRASKLDFDADLKEEGLFNYAKLSYELEFHQVALEATQEYLDTYPRSKKQEEAKTLLAEVLLSTKNYRAAVDILESIGTRGKAANTAYQKVTYYRGLEFYNERAFENAISMFMRSEANRNDEEIYALSTYWKAEAMYEVRKYGEAVTNFNRFLQLPAARNTDVYSYANYALAYAAFRNDRYNTAANYFERFLATGGKDGIEINTRNDAVARLADSYFGMKNYGKALEQYNRLINAKAPSQDYALFQRGIIQGLQGDNTGKIATLQSVIRAFPKSNYADDVAFEIPYTYFLMGNHDGAISGLQKMVEQYPRSSYVPRALVTIGLVQYNKDDNDAALKTFQRVVDQYATTDEAKQAMRSIENIYLDKGDATGYIRYATGTNIGDLSTAQQDGHTFSIAKTLFDRGSYQGAVEAVNAYFDKFPKPINEKHARFIRGESYAKLGRDTEALHDFNIIMNDWTSAYTEQTLLSVAKLHLNKKAYNEAVQVLKKLELTSEYKSNYGFAINNLLMSYFNIGDFVETQNYAKLVREYEKSSEEDIALAHLYSGKAYAATNKAADALKEFNLAALKSKTIIGAEARYRVGEQQLKAKQYDKAIESAFDISNTFSSYDYWVAKGFILMADAYAAKGDKFQAKSTLESVIENYDNKTDDVLKEAKSRLEKLK